VSEPAYPISISAAARAADTLREHIIEGRYRSGEPLRETSLARSLGVSRNTVRESFRMLAEDGLVEHAPNRGVTVRGLGAADIEDIYRIRRALELLGLEAVAPDPSELADVVTSAEEAAEVGDWLAVSTADLRFHQAIVAALGSPRLDAMFQRLLAELRLAFADMPDLREFHEPYLRRNRGLVELLRAGDVTAARQELTSYLEAAERQILGMLRRLDC
jgi:DNA-binding GntR family transcriptional regulator